MKIALPSRGDQVDGHFGHCEYFTVFTVDEDRTIVAEEKLSPAQGCGCKSNIISTLSGLGVTVMLAGNLGAGAAHHLADNGIELVRGCSGGLRAVAEAWLAGTLQDSRVTCDHHGECGHSH